jgi:anti-sigma factor RsiW
MNTTTHPIALEEIMAFLDGELSGDRAQSVSAHIEQCFECQNVAETLRVTSEKIAAWTIRAPQRLNEDLFLARAGRIRSERKLERSSSTLRDLLSRRWVWAPGLSLIVVLFALAVLVPKLHRTMPSSTAVMFEVNRQMEASESGGGRGSLGKLTTQSEAKNKVDDFSSVGPMIARTVSLSIVPKDFEAARISLDAILARYNGYTAALNVGTPQGAARVLQASLRIPAPQLPIALAELKSLGRVESETQNGEEVTEQHADVVARLKNFRETEQRLLDVLRTRTGKVKDILEVEEEMARVRGEIEQMEAKQKNLEHRVDFVTIDLKLAEEYKAQLSSPAPSVAMQLRNATVNGFRTASLSLLGIILFFSESGPTLFLWLAILFFPARLLWRRYRRALARSSLLGA